MSESTLCFLSGKCFGSQLFQRVLLIFPEPEGIYFPLWLVPMVNLSVNRANVWRLGDETPLYVQLGSHPTYLDFNDGQFCLLCENKVLSKVKENFPCCRLLSCLYQFKKIKCLFRWGVLGWQIYLICFKLTFPNTEDLLARTSFLANSNCSQVLKSLFFFAL